MIIFMILRMSEIDKFYVNWVRGLCYSVKCYDYLITVLYRALAFVPPI